MRLSKAAAICLLAAGVATAAALPSCAQEQPEAPAGGGNAGSPSVIVDGKQAQRAGDGAAPGAVQLSPDVLIDGKPAVTCANGTKGGSPNVFINGKPLARAGDCK